MARKLLPQEFYKELSKKLDCDFDKAQFIWENIVEFLIDEMKIYGSVQCPSFGEFRSITKGGKKYHVPNSIYDKERLNTDAPFREEYIDFYQEIHFKSAETLKQVMNNKIDTTAVWKRAREQVRKYKEEQAAFEKEKIVLARKQNAMNMVREKKLENIRKKKEFEKLSKTKQDKIIKEQSKNTDWEE